MAWYWWTAFAWIVGMLIVWRFFYAASKRNEMWDADMQRYLDGHLDKEDEKWIS